MRNGVYLSLPPASASPMIFWQFLQILINVNIFYDGCFTQALYKGTNSIRREFERECASTRK
ncbi:protein of unknown function [Paraburkholderia kururiensis]